MTTLRAAIVAGAALLTLAARQTGTLTVDLDRIFAAPMLARAEVGVRVDSLASGATLYTRDAGKLLVPASNMKLVVLAAAAERLGWDFTFQTRLEATGTVTDGVLHGDLIVVGTGDPTITSQDFGPAPLFFEWADALAAAGIHRVDGRLLGDARAFDDMGLGPGWAWDDLALGFAAPVGALTYNENTAVLRATPGRAAGDPISVVLTPPGHQLEIHNEATTGARGSDRLIQLYRLPGTRVLDIRGSIPAGGATVVENTPVQNPTIFFVEGLKLALASRGIAISGGAADIQAAQGAPSSDRRVIATRTSPPLSAFAGYYMKVSRNVYSETLLKTMGRAEGGVGTFATGRKAIGETLTSWGITPDSFVIDDGSGLTRSDGLTADAVVTILSRMWHDERDRAPFVASLPVGGHDGTLAARMKNPALETHVLAKTGSLTGVRALSGYLETSTGERLAFSILINNFTAPASDIDAVVERALTRLAR